MERPYFPMFIDLKDRRFFVAGGGRIARRRIEALIKFGADIHVAAPRICPEIESLAREGKIKTVLRECRPSDLEGMDFAIAATDDREVNRAVYTECRKRGIPINVADDKTLCDFYFPALVLTDDVVIGIGSGGENPSHVKNVRRKIQGLMELPSDEEGKTG